MSFVDVFVSCCFLLGGLSAALVAFHPNILYSAVALIFTLLSVAGLYASLGADFLAGVQLIIYVGGIIVILLFAIMMSENIYRARFLDGARKFFVPFITSAILLFGFLRLITRIDWPKVDYILRKPTTEGIGEALIGPYAIVFQYVAIVLLAGLIGAVVVARPHHDEENPPRLES